MSLVIIKHDPKGEEGEKIMEERLYLVENEHDWSMSLRPFFIYKDIMYFTCFHNDFTTNKITF